MPFRRLKICYKELQGIGYFPYKKAADRNFAEAFTWEEETERFMAKMGSLSGF